MKTSKKILLGGLLATSAAFAGYNFVRDQVWESDLICKQGIVASKAHKEVNDLRGIGAILGYNAGDPWTGFVLGELYSTKEQYLTEIIVDKGTKKATTFVLDDKEVYDTLKKGNERTLCYKERWHLNYLGKKTRIIGYLFEKIKE